MSSSSISVVLPAYNEEENIETAVRRALAVLASLSPIYEVIVVDDGSVDQTGAIADTLARENDHVRAIHHKPNQGYGAALRTGFTHARYDLVFYTDSDNQFDIAELKYFLPLMDTHDLAVGFRVYRYDSVIRCFLSWVYNRLVSLLFRVRVRDVDCSFKLFRKEVLEKIDIECTDFFVDTELIAKARKWNFRIVEKGVRHYPRMAGQTTVRPSDIPRTLRTLSRMWRQIYFPKKVPPKLREITGETERAGDPQPPPLGCGDAPQPVTPPSKP
ncbi:MAG: glycosyltransferase family 2 protein [Chloroflexi bacterium]|nr:glycosyltransferase family 2 protein [Chloroflexota bacterium]